MQISGHNNVTFINNYSTLSEERHKKISNILSSTESETNRNAFQQTCRVEKTERLIIYLNKLNWFTEMYLTTMSNTQMLNMCVAFTCLQTVWVILKYACSSNQVNIYACVSYKGGSLQLYGSFLFLFF
jgi:hypothetical protein